MKLKKNGDAHRVTKNIYIKITIDLSLQINDASHFIDGSQVYGSNDYIASTLRSFSNGMLKSVVEENQEFCPHSSFQSSDTNAFFYNSGKLTVSHNAIKIICGMQYYSFNETFNCSCFIIGDARANTNLGIALFHNMFLRFHNFVALRLKTANSEWSDETLYQESRKIVAAIIQHITYTEFLPIILGELCDVLCTTIINNAFR